jgi:zinc protease
VEVGQLSNKIALFYTENDTLPLVSIRLHMEIGREANPAGKGGLASLMADLLDEGTKSYDALGLAGAIQGLGAQLGVSASGEGIDITLDALTSELGPGLDLLAEVVLAPSFKDFNRIKAQTLADLAAQASSPQARLREVALAQIFGPQHPYGVPVQGTAASVGALKKGDVKKLYKSWWHAGNASFVVAGAVEKEAILKELEARFGVWERLSNSPPTIAPPSPLIKTRVVFVEFPGSVQSVIGIYTPGLARNSPDWYPAIVSSTMIGGMFSSPLNMVLREEKGWSYGAYGSFTESRDYGLLAFRTSVQADKTAPAVTEMLNVLGNAATTSPSAELVQMAKDYLADSLPGSFETNSAIAASLAAIPTYTLNNDVWSAYERDISNVSVARVATQLNRYFRSERQLVVVVGPSTVKGKDASGVDLDVNVREELKGLGFEYVEVSAQ